MIKGGYLGPPQPTAKYDKATACLAKDRAVLLTYPMGGSQFRDRPPDLAADQDRAADP